MDFDQLLTEAEPLSYGDQIPPVAEIREFGADSDRLCGPSLFMYRAVARCYDPYADEYSSSGYLKVEVHFSRYRAVRFTRCGVWVTADPHWYDRPKLRWVNLNSAGKRLCYVSKEAAMRNLRHRNARHVQILRHQLACAEQVYEVINQKAAP